MNKILVAIMLLFCLHSVQALTRAEVEPLEKRVKNAALVFTGEITKSWQENGWTFVELSVKENLKGAKGKKSIQAVLGKYLGKPDRFKKGSIGVVIVSDQHKGKYWFRDDKFEDLQRLDEVKKILKESK